MHLEHGLSINLSVEDGVGQWLCCHNNKKCLNLKNELTSRGHVGGCSRIAKCFIFA